jgi:hypothetical protein
LRIGPLFPRFYEGRPVTTYFTTPRFLSMKNITGLKFLLENSATVSEIKLRWASNDFTDPRYLPKNNFTYKPYVLTSE